MTPSPFSATYAEARGKFLEAAGAAGAELSAISHPERGPDGGDLATDVADRLNEDEARREEDKWSA